jgi:hypothetical protein
VKAIEKMKKTEIYVLLNKVIESKYQAKINRDKIDVEPIYCIPLLLGQKLLLVQNIIDFQLDGYMIIRIKDISSVRSDESERFSEYIFKEEGMLNQIKVPTLINLENWKSSLQTIQTLRNNIIIECEKENEFYIGKITKINSKSVFIFYFNGIGEWDQKPTEIFFKDITSVSFAGRYINIISKYIKECPL